MKRSLVLSALIVFTMLLGAGGLEVVRAEDGHGHLGYSDESVDRITVHQLKSRIDDGEEIMILDVRSKESGGIYGGLKIRGAVLMPLNEVEERMFEIPFGAMVAAYCT